MTVDLTIGAVTAQTGVTAKALRLYETRGLLKPARSESDRRIYDDTDLIRLEHILTLKSLGLTLKQIGTVLKSSEIDASRILTLRLEQTIAEQNRLKQLRNTLDASLKTLEDGKNIGVETLCKLIKTHESQVTEIQFYEILDRWFTPSEQRQWQNTIRDHGMYGERRSPHWEALYRRAETAIDLNLSVEDVQSVELAKDWAEALKNISDNMDSTIWNKGTALIRAMAEDKNPSAANDIDKKTHAFIFAAIDYAKRHGYIP